MRTSPLAAAAVIAAAATAAPADVIPFQVFENYDGVPVAGLNLIVEIASAPGNRVDLTFRNQSTIDSIVTWIQIEQSERVMQLLSNPTIPAQAPGVGFVPNGSPPTPPGSIAPHGGPWAGAFFAADAANPAPQNGLSPGESLVLRFDRGASVNQIASAIANRQVRIVQHIQGMGSGGESSIWTSTIPTPGTAAVVAAGMLTILRRRRS